MKKLFSILLSATAVSLGAMAQDNVTNGVKPLDRGVMAIHQSSGNLVSWRARKSDNDNFKYKLFRGNATNQPTAVNSGNYIMGKTNFLDEKASANSVYRLEVYDENNQLVETSLSEPTWANQTKYITLEGGAPVDPTSNKATYTPNDASYCDMDGDGEYEIILKWAPSNEKDAANSGNTSPAFYSCYKLNGKRLWMLHTGANMFNSAHSTQFIAWDMDGDGYGEFMVKTAPGAIDANGKYILMGSDSPTANLKSSKGKQDKGGEYLTIFDGRTGAELKTIAYHTKYADETTSFWGDSNQNRSERYLAAIAWLDGEDANPSAIFARGYYSGAKIGAYDWDGKNLTMRWLHRSSSASASTVKYANGTTKSQTTSVYGEGAHWIGVADVNGDGKQEITYGSSALKPDGTVLYRTGLGHGDALHIGDFVPSNPGLEVFMAHEHSPYGVDLRDGTTGKIMTRQTESGDTGRGIMGLFNPESDNGLFQSSARLTEMYDADGTRLSTSISHGGGAMVNYRIYWTGNLSDQFFDKSIIEAYNPQSKSLDRILGVVNGGNYIYGNLNNSSKNNACVVGDLLGDWREEIVTWEGDAENGFRLIINATNYQTDYTMPHLMDDYAYRAQIINQNCCYNQPAHVSYNPRVEKTVTRKLMEIEPTTEAGQTLGKYWDCFYTTYPVIIPEGVKVWSLGNKQAADQTVALTEFKGKTLPANCGIIYNATTPEAKFVPTSIPGSTKPSTAYLKGLYCDSVVENTTVYTYYEFRNGDRGLGFYKVDGNVIPGRTGYAAYLLAKDDSYVLPASVNPNYDVTTGVHEVSTDSTLTDSDASTPLYNMAGIQVKASQLNGGVYIKNGKKFVK